MTTARRFRWVWPLAISAAALGTMVLISVLKVPPPMSTMSIQVRDLPDISRHTIPFYLTAAGSRGKPPTAIWLVRHQAGWWAFSNQSSHPRACEVQWMADEGRFIDPCLGTVYDRTGLNIAGPAPTGLDAYLVTVTARSDLEVDLSDPRPVTRARQTGH